MFRLISKLESFKALFKQKVFYSRILTLGFVTVIVFLIFVCSINIVGKKMAY